MAFRGIIPLTNSILSKKTQGTSDTKLTHKNRHSFVCDFT